MKYSNPVAIVLLLLGLGTAARAEDAIVLSKKSNVTLSGRIHAQFHTTSVEGAETSSTFLVRRARVKADVTNSSGRLRGAVEYDLAEGSASLTDAYVDLAVNDRFQIKMGQFKKPFSLWESTSTNQLMVIERANRIMESSNMYSSNNVIVKDGFYGSRDIGVQAHGSSGRVDYAFGLFNGNGSNQKHDNDSGKTFGGRVVVNIRDDLAIGGSLSNRMIDDYAIPRVISGTDTSFSVTDENFHALEADFEYGIRHHVEKEGPWIQAEIDFGKNPAFRNTKTDFMGFVAAASYNVLTEKSDLVHSVRPAFRFDWSKRNIDDDDTLTILLTPGMDIFFDTNNRLAINLDVNIPNADDAATEYAFRAQFQMLI